MGRGACIVANDVPEHREVLGDAGRYYRRNDPADLGRILVELVRDEPARTSHGAAAGERAKSLFSWDHVTDDYETLFSRLVTRRA